MSINRHWKRFVAVGCSHGDMIDTKARDAVLGFVERWQPHSRIHLGDYLDTTAFRGGAKGSKDETVDIGLDLHGGLEFLRQYRPTHLLNGNHDVRLWEAMDHHNAIVKQAARSVVGEIETLVKSMRTQFHLEYAIDAPHIRLGDASFLHGYMYGSNAIQEHAEHFGKCVFAHLHTVGMRAGRRSDNPVAYCVGLLGSIPKMKYANRRRATTQWGNGLAFGEYCDTETIVWLSSRNRDGNWRLPV